MKTNDIELRMIAAQITMKASVGAEDLCSRYSSVSRMLGNMFNDVYYILQDVRTKRKDQYPNIRMVILLGILMDGLMPHNAV